MEQKKKEHNLIGLFLEGLLALMPLALTALIIYWLGSMFVNLTDFVPGRILKLIFGSQEMPQWLVPLLWIGLYTAIAIAFFLFTALLGAIIRRSIGRRVFDLWEKMLSKIPIIRNLYDPLKQVLTSLLGGRKDRFKRVVLVEYPRKGIYSLAFVTSEISRSNSAQNDGSDGGAAQRPSLMTVFIPSSPNPTTGWMLVVPSTEVTAVDMTVEDGVKLIFSGGLVSQNVSRSGALIRRLEESGEIANELPQPAAGESTRTPG